MTEAFEFEGPTALDLFSGCGGLTVGLRKAGFRVVGAVEIDGLSAGAYAANHPRTPVWHADIRALDPRQVRRRLGLKKGDLDLLAGCPPCQGFSRLRTLNGTARAKDARNNLVFEFVRFVEEFRPRAVLMENVPGLATDFRLKRFIRALEASGYNTRYEILDAARYGVPQRRERLLVLAALGGEIEFPREAKVARSVRDAIGHLPRAGRSGDSAHDTTETRSPRVARLISHIPKNGGSRRDLPRRYHLACHESCDGFKDVYGRMRWDDVAPTLTGGFVNPSKGRFLHPRDNRAITVREAALLQTFPARYRFPMEAGKYPVAVMIGNAIPPEFVRRQAIAVRRFLADSARDARRTQQPADFSR